MTASLRKGATTLSRTYKLFKTFHSVVSHAKELDLFGGSFFAFLMLVRPNSLDWLMVKSVGNPCLASNYRGLINGHFPINHFWDLH